MEKSKERALKSMVHLVHTRTGRGAEHATNETVQLRLNRIDRKMEEISEPRTARTMLLAELKELEAAFRSGDMGDVCDEAGDVLHCSIYLHAATVEHGEKMAANRTAVRSWDTVVLAIGVERDHRLGWLSEKTRSQVDEAGRNKLMRDLGTRMMAPMAKTCLMEEILKGMQE